MKFLSLTLTVLLLTTNAFATDFVECSNDLGELKLKRDGKDMYLLSLSEALSSKYLGEYTFEDDERMILGKKKSDLSTGDGNYEILLTFPKRSLNKAKGKKFNAVLEVSYSDISEDYVKHILTCEVIG